MEEYLRRAHSKERLMDDDRGSSVPSQFEDQLQRTREAISRSRQHLDQIEEIEVCCRVLACIDCPFLIIKINTFR